MRYRRLRILVFATLLATAFTLHCLPTEAQSQDRRRSTTFLAASSQESWPEWDGVTAHPELTDAHPTTGWPTEFGRICVTFSSGASGEYRSIIDGRQDGDDPRPYLSVVDDGRIRFGIQTVGSIAGGEIIPFHTHTACVDRSYGPTTSLYLDGQLIGTSTTLPAWDWHPTARLGSRYGGADPLGGEIKSIQWRGLRLACDLRSDTCSDGRQIATTRPTPVPCEVSPGVWEMVPEDTGCYGVRGLESWAQNTSYLSYGAELDRSPWVVMSNSQLSALPEGGYRICQTGTGLNTGLNQTYSAGPQEGEWLTSAVIARPNTASAMMLGTEISKFNNNLVMTGQDWGIYSYSASYAGTTQRVHIYPRPGGQQLCIDLLAAWLTKSDTPGRACWGGEAPVTCAADRHTISTEGWPSGDGEISVVFTEDVTADADAVRIILDSRPGGTIGFSVRVTTEGDLGVTSGGSFVRGPALTPGVPYHARFARTGSTLTVYLNGVKVLERELPPWEWDTTATLGRHPTGSNILNGSISSLRVRSFE